MFGVSKEVEKKKKKKSRKKWKSMVNVISAANAFRASVKPLPLEEPECCMCMIDVCSMSERETPFIMNAIDDVLRELPFGQRYHSIVIIGLFSTDINVLRPLQASFPPSRLPLPDITPAKRLDEAIVSVRFTGQSVTENRVWDGISSCHVFTSRSTSSVLAEVFDAGKLVGVDRYVVDIVGTLNRTMTGLMSTGSVEVVAHSVEESSLDRDDNVGLMNRAVYSELKYDIENALRDAFKELDSISKSKREEGDVYLPNDDVGVRDSQPISAGRSDYSETDETEILHTVDSHIPQIVPSNDETKELSTTKNAWTVDSTNIGFVTLHDQNVDLAKNVQRLQRQMKHTQTALFITASFVAVLLIMVIVLAMK